MDSNCATDTSNFNHCNESSQLLDSVHGPQSFSENALERYYTEIEESGRVVFQFLSDVNLEVVQIYYYIRSDLPRPRLYLYDVDAGYHPRHNIPSSASYLGLLELGFPNTGEFQSECVTVPSHVRNLLIAAPRSTTLYISEVNFFSSPVSHQVCNGIFMPVSTTMATTTTLLTEDSTTEPFTAEVTTMEPSTTTTPSTTTMEPPITAQADTTIEDSVSSGTHPPESTTATAGGATGVITPPPAVAAVPDEGKYR